MISQDIILYIKIGNNMNWYKTAQEEILGKHQTGPGVDGYIFQKLTEKGITHEGYNDIAEPPISEGTYDAIDTLDPNEWKFLGKGAQSIVFKHVPTGRVQKFPSGVRSFEHRRTQTIIHTNMDALINKIKDAAHINACIKILGLYPLNMTVDRNGITHQDYIDRSTPVKPREYNKILNKKVYDSGPNPRNRRNRLVGPPEPKPPYYIDEMRGGAGNAYLQPNGQLAIIDGIHLAPYQTMGEEKEFLETSLYAEIDKIINGII